MEGLMNARLSTVEPTTLTSGSPQDVANSWLDAFGSALEEGDSAAVAGLFVKDGWLRDRLALTWDLRTLHGRDKIQQLLEDRIGVARLSNVELDPALEPVLVDEGEGLTWLQASFTFESEVGRGRGFVRLVEDEEESTVGAWTALVELRELKGFEEPQGARRPHGASHGAERGSENWLDRRQRKEAFEESEPSAIVVGAGQSGISLAARLGQLGVDTLVLERNARVGDSWRNRYHSLVLHDPIWSDHLPYLNYPETWPRFIPKDKLGDWFEAYASIMELNVWTGVELGDCEFDSAAGVWNATVTRADGTTRILHPKHLIFATGHSGLPVTPSLEGSDRFEGTVMHSSAVREADVFEGKRVLVVGAGNSSHDISHDLVEAGADVTMLQRSETYVMGSSNGFGVLHAGVYEQDGLDIDTADHLANSLPIPVMFELHKKLVTPVVRDLDSEMHEGLEKAGFRANSTNGIMELYLGRGGGYYIDVGASQLIGEGRIKVKQGVEIQTLTQDGVVFTDGSEEKFDVVILATGYGNMREVARKFVGDEIAEQCIPVWGIDEEGEMQSIWGPSGHDHLWFMGGNLGFVRHFSLTLALQIKAAEENLRDRYEPEVTA
jgi:putative flavoprotein involved in K+ transport